MKKLLLSVILIFSLSGLFAAEQNFFPLEQLETFYQKGKLNGFSWCECEAAPKQKRFEFIQDIVACYTSGKVPLKKTLTYTSFASGTGLLQDYVTLRSLNHLGLEECNFNCIDPLFQDKQAQLSTRTRFITNLDDNLKITGMNCYPSADDYLTDINALQTNLLSVIDMPMMHFNRKGPLQKSDIKALAPIIGYMKIKETKMATDGLVAVSGINWFEKHEKRIKEYKEPTLAPTVFWNQDF